MCGDAGSRESACREAACRSAARSTGQAPLVATTTRRGPLTSLELVGDLDVATETVLRDALTEAIHASTSLLVVDLAGVAFCGARGIAVLVQATATAAARDVELILTRCPPSLFRLCALLGLDDDLRLATGPVGDAGP